MADPPENRAESEPTSELSLPSWTLATFDVVLFVLLVVLSTHASGALGGLLSGLNTVIGIVVFCYLWVLVVLAVRWVLADAPLDETRVRTLAVRGMAAGAVVGIVFLLGTFLVAVVPQLLTNPIEAISLVLIPAIGSIVAAVVGSVVGLVAALVNVAVYRIAASLVPPPRDSERTADTDLTPDRQ